MPPYSSPDSAASSEWSDTATSVDSPPKRKHNRKAVPKESPKKKVPVWAWIGIGLVVATVITVVVVMVVRARKKKRLAGGAKVDDEGPADDGSDLVAVSPGGFDEPFQKWGTRKDAKKMLDGDYDEDDMYDRPSEDVDDDLPYGTTKADLRYDTIDMSPVSNEYQRDVNTSKKRAPPTKNGPPPPVQRPKFVGGQVMLRRLTEAFKPKQGMDLSGPLTTLRSNARAILNYVTNRFKGNRKDTRKPKSGQVRNRILLLYDSRDPASRAMCALIAVLNLKMVVNMVHIAALQELARGSGSATVTRALKAVAGATPILIADLDGQVSSYIGPKGGEVLTKLHRSSSSMLPLNFSPLTPDEAALEEDHMARRMVEETEAVKDRDWSSFGVEVAVTEADAKREVADRKRFRDELKKEFGGMRLPKQKKASNIVVAGD